MADDAPSAGEALDQLLLEVEWFLKRFVVFGDPYQVVAVVLFVAHTHALDAADVSPYLLVTAPTKRSGKTRLLEVLELLVHDPLMVSSISEAALFRTVHERHSTLLLDEIDAVFGPKASKNNEGIRSLINAGHRRGVRVARMGGSKMNVLQYFETFSPKVLAGIGNQPDTIADRSIPINMKRRARGEPVERFRYRIARADAVPMCEALASAMSSLVDQLREARPDTPYELHDRAADFWEPLLAIADAAGGDWPDRARVAAVALSSEVAPEDDSLAIRLLADVKALFERTGVDRILSKDLRAALLEIEDAPWGDLYGGKEISARRIATLLRPYGPRPRDIRINDPQTYAEVFPSTPFADHGKGYERADFADAFERYLPVEPTNSDISDKSSSHSEMSRMSQIGGPPEAVGEFPGLARAMKDFPAWASYVSGDGSFPTPGDSPDWCLKCENPVERYDKRGRPWCEVHIPLNLPIPWPPVLPTTPSHE